jgi:four helix bundle protein
MLARLNAAPPRNLRVYRRAHQLNADLFWRTRQFPAPERRALTRQLRETTRVLLRHIEGAWQHRYRPGAFRTHLTQALGACARLTLWLKLAHECHYLSALDYADLVDRTDEIDRLLRRFQQHRIRLLAGPEQPSMPTAWHASSQLSD